MLYIWSVKNPSTAIPSESRVCASVTVSNVPLQPVILLDPCNAVLSRSCQWEKTFFLGSVGNFLVDGDHAWYIIDDVLETNTTQLIVITQELRLSNLVELRGFCILFVYLLLFT